MKVSLRTKIILSFFSVVTIAILITGFLTYRQASSALENNLGQNLANIAGVTVEKIPGDLHEELHKKSDENTAAYKEIKKYLQSVQKEAGLTYIYTMRKEGEKIYFVVDAATGEDMSHIGDEYELQSEMLTAYEGKKTFTKEMYTDEWGTFKTGYAPIRDAQGKVVAILGIDISAENVLKQEKELLINIAIGALIGLVIALIFSIFLGNSLTKPTVTILKVIKEMADAGGDLSKRINIKTGDEIEELGLATNQLMSSIGGMVSELAASAESLNRESVVLIKLTEEVDTFNSHVAMASEQMAADAEKEASKAEEMARNIEHIGGAIKEASQKSNTIATQSQQIKILALDGNQSLTEVQEQMELIQTKVKQANEIISQLSARSVEVGRIVDLIKTIADQTNLLALNAAIEAARAGEEGRGFAVVANEVRKLAEESTSAAEDISKLINQIQSETDQAVTSINSGVNEVDRGRSVSQKAEHSFHQINSALDEILESIGETASLYQRVESSNETIIKTVDDIVNTSQYTAASSEELSSSITAGSETVASMSKLAGQVNGVAKAIEDMIRKFKV